MSKVDNIRANIHDEDMGQTYECWARSRGALLSLPHGARSEHVIRTKLFEDYIIDNVDSWLRWSKKEGLPVENTEDLILVVGCTLATSWAVAAFDNTMSKNSDASEISLEARNSYGGGTQFFFRNIRGNVEYHNSRFDPNVQEPLPQNQCVFIRGFCAKRTFYGSIVLRAAAEPRPDDPDDRREDGIPVTGTPDISKDIPMTEDIIAITHVDDLQPIEDVETLTADLVEGSLCEKQMPLVVENGVAILRPLVENKPLVSEEKKGISHAPPALNEKPIPPAIHPASTKYNFKFDSSDYDDPAKEINALAACAAYPPISEGHQGYSQVITVEASVNSRSIGFTVQGYMKT